VLPNGRECCTLYFKDQLRALIEHLLQKGYICEEERIVLFDAVSQATDIALTGGVDDFEVEHAVREVRLDFGVDRPQYLRVSRPDMSEIQNN
jgi:hypothetical protein